ncbi:MAG: NAD(P)H-dependent oxidoreductase subunit E, partial [Dehalococcoidia bacterium]
MARGRAKARSKDSPPARGKGRGGPPAPIRAINDIEGGDGQLAESVLNRVSDKLGIPVSQISQMVDAIDQVAREVGDTDRIINEYRGDKTALIQILLEIQRENRWLPKDVLMSVCRKLGVPLSRAYRVATFYKAF